MARPLGGGWGGGAGRSVAASAAVAGADTGCPGGAGGGGAAGASDLGWAQDPPLPAAAGGGDVPAPSTITAILRRHDLLAAAADTPHPWQRFEHAAPNDLWQLDFLGHRPVEDGQRVHPLTVLDDHSRFLLALVACSCEQQEVVQAHLTACFRR